MLSGSACTLKTQSEVQVCPVGCYCGPINYNNHSPSLKLARNAIICGIFTLINLENEECQRTLALLVALSYGTFCQGMFES